MDNKKCVFKGCFDGDDEEEIGLVRDLDKVLKENIYLKDYIEKEDDKKDDGNLDYMDIMKKVEEEERREDREGRMDMNKNNDIGIPGSPGTRAGVGGGPGSERDGIMYNNGCDNGKYGGDNDMDDGQVDEDFDFMDIWRMIDEEERREGRVDRDDMKYDNKVGGPPGPGSRVRAGGPGAATIASGDRNGNGSNYGDGIIMKGCGHPGPGLGVGPGTGPLVGGGYGNGAGGGAPAKAQHGNKKNGNKRRKKSDGGHGKGKKEGKGKGRKRKRESDRSGGYGAGGGNNSNNNNDEYRGYIMDVEDYEVYDCGNGWMF